MVAACGVNGIGWRKAQVAKVAKVATVPFGDLLPLRQFETRHILQLLCVLHFRYSWHALGQRVMLLEPGSRPVPNYPDYELIRKLGAGAFGDVWHAHGPGGVDVARFVGPSASRGPVAVRDFKPLASSRQVSVLASDNQESAGCPAGAPFSRVR